MEYHKILRPGRFDMWTSRGNVKRNLKAVTWKGRTLHACLVDAVLLPPSASSTSFILPLLLLLSVRLFALPDVSCQEEAACLSSVRTSDSHVDGLSQLPFLRSLKVSESSLHGRATATIPHIEGRREERLVEVFTGNRGGGRRFKYVLFKEP